MKELVYKCAHCGGELKFQVEESSMDIIHNVMKSVRGLMCNACSDQAEQDRSVMEARSRADAIQSAQAARESEWLKFCPMKFRNPNTNLLPDDESRQGFIKAQRWIHGNHDKGLMFFGGTGKGKTLTMWSVLKPFFLASKPFYFATATEFASQCSAIASESSFRLEKFIDKIRESEIVCIDDLGKRKMPDGAEGYFHDIIDYRSARGLPFIITCEGNAKWLATRIDESRRASLIRRIVDSTEQIPFGPPLKDYNWPVNS